MSTTASPVTQVALTEVNSATPGLADPAPVRIIGSMSSSVPTPHRIANDTVMERAGERRPIRACCAWDAGQDLRGALLVRRRHGGPVGRPRACLEPAPRAEHPASRLVARPTRCMWRGYSLGGRPCPFWPPPARPLGPRGGYGGRVSDRVAVIADPSLSAYNFGHGHPMAPIRVQLALRLAEDFGLLHGAQRRPDPRGRARGCPRPREGPRAGLPHGRAHRRAHRGSGRSEVRDGHR